MAGMKGIKNAEQWCFSNGREEWKVVVFQQWEGRTKQMLDGVVSEIRMMGEWRAGVFGGWERKC
jgi:hypothetical protein